MSDKELYDKLANQNIRIFNIHLEGNTRQTITVIHSNKTVTQWRKDMRKILLELKDLTDKSGRANDGICNGLNDKLIDLGYIDINDLVADVYEGRITNKLSSIVDSPVHEDQKNGFGHYGYESK